MKGLLKCTNFSQETMALLAVMNPDNEGGLGNQDTSDPNSKVFVDPAALSQISEIEYDYSDLYDYEDDGEDEVGKSRRDIKEEEELTSSVPNTSTEKSTVKTNPMVVVSKVVKTIAKKKKELLMKEDKVEYLQSLNGEEESKMSEEEKISMNVIRSADEDQEIVEESSEASLEGVAGSTTAKYSTEGIAK